MADAKTRFPEEVLKTELEMGASFDRALAAAVATSEIQKFNTCHEPSGPAGGQFCSSGVGGGGGGSGSGDKWRQGDVASATTLEGADKKLFEQAATAGRALYGKDLIMGTAKVQRGSLDDYLGGSEEKIYDTFDYVFYPSTGKGKDVADTPIRASHADKDGKIYIAGGNGVFVLDPKTLGRQRVAPSAFGAAPKAFSAADVSRLPSAIPTHKPAKFTDPYPGMDKVHEALNVAYHYLKSQGWKPKGQDGNTLGKRGAKGPYEIQLGALGGSLSGSLRPTATIRQGKVSETVSVKELATRTFS